MSEMKERKKKQMLIFSMYTYRRMAKNHKTVRKKIRKNKLNLKIIFVYFLIKK